MSHCAEQIRQALEWLHTAEREIARIDGDDARLAKQALEYGIKRIHQALDIAPSETAMDEVTKALKESA